MNKEEAEEYAKNMTYRDAVCNALQGRCVPYRKATLIKLYELLDRLEQESCKNAISRTDMLDAIGHGTTYTSEELQRIIKALPPVNPQPKMGRWITQDIHNCHTNFKCSKCGYIHNFMHLYGKPTADYTYCPNCGAQMQEVEE